MVLSLLDIGLVLFYNFIDFLTAVAVSVEFHKAEVLQGVSEARNRFADPTTALISRSRAHVAANLTVAQNKAPPAQPY